MRYFVQFSYNGKAYHGWQNQPNAITVQEVLERSISTLTKSAVSLTGAGRTDAGVHAKEMYAHFDTEEIPETDALTYRMNALLPADIAIQTIFEVLPDAHARFDATERTYEYWITREKNPFYEDFAHYIKQPLNIDRMNVAASLLLQYVDFQCFSKSNSDVRTYICDVKHAEWRLKNDLLIFTISADRFLRNMVRAIVGTLLDVGMGKSTLDDVKAVINSRDRSRAGASVPAKGLYLTKILYPSTILAKHG